MVRSQKETKEKAISSHLVISDAHAHYQHNNDRADYLGKLIVDLRPDVVVFNGDCWDMPSLSSYDKGKKSFQGRTYQADVDAGIDFQERLWSPLRTRKRKHPRRVFLIGNHEERIARAIDIDPILEGKIGYSDLQLQRWYPEVIHYEGRTPGTIEIDGVTYGHYFISGVLGRAISGEHPEHSLLTKKFTSCTSGHSHLAGWARRTTAYGRPINGRTTGWYGDYRPDWAGKISDLWWSGVVFKDNVSNGDYDPRFISTESLRKCYQR